MSQVKPEEQSLKICISCHNKDVSVESRLQPLRGSCIDIVYLCRGRSFTAYSFIALATTLSTNSAEKLKQFVLSLAKLL